MAAEDTVGKLTPRQREVAAWAVRTGLVPVQLDGWSADGTAGGPSLRERAATIDGHAAPASSGYDAADADA